MRVVSKRAGYSLRTPAAGGRPPLNLINARNWTNDLLDLLHVLGLLVRLERNQESTPR